MSYQSRLQKAYEGACRLPLCLNSKYVLFSDCHRGVGNSNDNFLKNQTLYCAALQHYLKTGFTYMELGDGDELWENRELTAIIDAHSSVFGLLARFYEQNRLYLFYGNHDIEKAKNAGIRRAFCAWPCCCHDFRLENRELFPNIKYYEGIVLEAPGQTAEASARTPGRHPEASAGLSSPQIFLTHGHQADTLNSVFWRLARFLVRHVWKPLERYGVLDPTSAAKNYARKRKTEDRLHRFAAQNDLILIAGHTHRPLLSESDLHYCNCGSCVHPYSITCIEIERMQITLVKWLLAAETDMRLRVTREVMAGPVMLS